MHAVARVDAHSPEARALAIGMLIDPTSKLAERLLLLRFVKDLVKARWEVNQLLVFVANSLEESFCCLWIDHAIRIREQKEERFFQFPSSLQHVVFGFKVAEIEA